jgi:hypothetical protein
MAVRVSDSLVINDIRSLWVSQRLERFHRSLLSFTAADFASERWVGRRLRRRVAGLLRDATELGIFAQWLHEFDGDSLVGLMAVWVAGFARSAGLFVLLVSIDDPDERLSAIREIERIWDETWECARALDPFLADDWESEPEEGLAEVLFGERPLVQDVNAGSAERAYPGGTEKLVALAAPQLRLVWRGGLFVPDGSAGNLMNLALKLGGAHTPLLANRTASLVGHLIQGAATVDLHTTALLINDFHAKQAGRIISSGVEYREHMRRAHEKPDGLDILDAYRNLTEGVLRPYGSLLIGFREIESGIGSESYRAFGTLGELEDALCPSSDELVSLLRLGLSRELRNYRAHEDVVRTAAGTTSVVLPDGEMADVDLSDVWWRTLILRSYLDGVDVAVQIAASNVGIHAPRPPQNVVITEALVQAYARVMAARLTDGSLTRLEITGAIVNLEFEGPFERYQLELLALALRRQLDPSVDTIRVIRAGEVVFDSSEQRL